MQDSKISEEAPGGTTEQQFSAAGQKRRKRTTGLQNFAHWDHGDQLKAFLAWLPKELHDAPGIDWATLDPGVMGYLIKIIGNSPDAAIMTVAAISTHGVMDLTSQRTAVRQVGQLFRSLRALTPTLCLTDLRQEHIWFDWAARQEKKDSIRQQLSCYAAIATGHFPLYLRRLTPVEQQHMQQYTFPPPPADLSKRFFLARRIRAAQKDERKGTTDILVPLYPILRQLVLLRKQLAERTLLTIREAIRRVESGEGALPYHFQHRDVLPEVSRDARTVAEVQLLGREVAMKLTLWDKRTWVTTHADRYGRTTVDDANLGERSYAEEQNCFFIQIDSAPRDFLWFGDLIEHRVFQAFNSKKKPTFSPEAGEEYQRRWQYARQCGFSGGCTCDPAGLLDPGRWFSLQAERGEEFLVEFESLYRSVLFGSTLAMLALSNGSRMNELLQVSMNKERKVTRTETVLLLGEDGLPQIGENGLPLTKQVKLHFQYLLPKGAKTEEERQLFPLSKGVLRLLEEIRQLLKDRHGEVPVVAPARSNTKREHLGPERYLFQWDALSSEIPQTISTSDAQTLLRFMLHGLDLYTTKGKPIRVAVHVLRHVMSTHARHYRRVPPEVIAHFFLHHRLRELTGHTPTLPEITEYYTLMTEEQRFAVIRADLDEQEEMDHVLLAMVPKVADLEQKNEAIQAAYEIWHALHPTAFGHCACPGLCPREQDRSLCLGCGYLVEDPEKLGAALVWRTDYARQAALFEVQGNAADARQARIKVQLLDDMINVMRMQLEEEAGGRYIPVFKVLPSPHRQLEAGDEIENEA